MHPITDTPFVFRALGEEGFDAVRPLWEKPKIYHLKLSPQFAAEMHTHTFEPRKQQLINKAAPDKLRIELVSLAQTGADMAYCIATVAANGRGEIDSMFVEEPFRRCGIGATLLRNALLWLDSAGASSKVVTVSCDNPEVMAFYQRFRFQPRTVSLQQVTSPRTSAPERSLPPDGFGSERDKSSVRSANDIKKDM